MAMDRNANTRLACCEARRQLAEQFAVAAQLYAETAVVLVKNGESSPEEYDRLCAITLEAQDRCEMASVAFEEHVVLHGGSHLFAAT